MPALRAEATGTTAPGVSSRPRVVVPGLLVVLLVVPGGLGQIAVSLRDRLLRLVANRRGILVPSLVADRREEEAEDKPEDETDLLSGALGAAELDEREEVRV